MMGYGLNIQMISVSQMLYDPITKGLLVKFGGLDLAGYYEMANRMVIQLRGLIVSAVQVLVPTIADLKEKNPDSIHKVYKEAWASSCLSPSRIFRQSWRCHRSSPGCGSDITKAVWSPFPYCCHSGGLLTLWLHLPISRILALETFRGTLVDTLSWQYSMSC